jgi:hypothetical protein
MDKTWLIRLDYPLLNQESRSRMRERHQCGTISLPRAQPREPMPEVMFPFLWKTITVRLFIMFQEVYHVVINMKQICVKELLIETNLITILVLSEYAT